MSLPQASNDYAAPADMALNKDAWDAAFTSVAARLNALEAAEADVQAVIDELTATALQSINANVAPQIATLNEALTTLQNEVAIAQVDLATLLAGELPATQILFAAAGGLSGGTVQATLEALDTRVAQASQDAAEAGAPNTKFAFFAAQ